MSDVRDYHDFTDIDTSVEDRKKLHVGDIYINEAKCLSCGDIVRSRNGHDFRTCSCEKLSVDGGSWYAKRCFADGPDSFEDNIVMYNNLEEDESGE